MDKRPATTSKRDVAAYAAQSGCSLYGLITPNAAELNRHLTMA